jgi:uncharacterized membrane protein
MMATPTLRFRSLKTVLLGIGLVLMGSIGNRARAVTIEPLDSAALQKAEAQSRISFQYHEAHYFADETRQFVLDFSTLTEQELGGQAVTLTVNQDTFQLDRIQPLLLRDLPTGQVNVAVRKDKEAEKPDKAFSFQYMESKPLFTNDAIVVGILATLLALIFITSKSGIGFFKQFYTYVPPLLLCYFLPALLNSFGVFSGDISHLYHVASRYLLPASLVLLTLSIDLNGVRKLGSKSVIMFLTGTVGIVVGGPLAVLIISSFAPDIVGGAGPDAVWRGLTTVAGSWIGGGANQTAMYEVFGASSQLFSAMIAVDVIVANIWMAFLLYGAGISSKIDKLFNADASAIDEVRQRIENYNLSVARIPTFPDLMNLVAVGLGMTAVGHLIADIVAPYLQETAPYLSRFSLTSKFFWIIVVVTTAGLILSFTKARRLEGVGASNMGSVFLYILVASIGMHMDILAIFDNPGLFMVGGLWMLIHVIILLSVGKIIKAPFFFTAVGSKANIGGAASAPIVASAFHPSLAPVGVLLAVLGYAIGTYAAWFCGILLQTVSA